MCVCVCVFKTSYWTRFFCGLSRYLIAIRNRLLSAGVCLSPERPKCITDQYVFDKLFHVHGASTVIASRRAVRYDNRAKAGSESVRVRSVVTTSSAFMSYFANISDKTCEHTLTQQTTPTS